MRAGKMRTSIRTILCSLAIVVASSSAAAPAPPAANPVAPADAARAASAPVVVDGREIMRLATLPGVITGPQRAAETTARIVDFASRGGEQFAVRSVTRDGVVALTADETFIVSLYPQDATLAGLPLDELAKRNAEQLRAAIQEHRHA